MRKALALAVVAAITFSLAGCDSIISSTVSAASYEAGKLFATAIPKEQLAAMNLLDPETFCYESATVAESTSPVAEFYIEEFAKGCIEVLSAE